MDDTPLSPNLSLNQEVKTMDFYDAIKALITGKTIRRNSWPGDDFAILVDSFVSIHINGETKHWIINDGDITGTDWIIING